MSWVWPLKKKKKKKDICQRSKLDQNNREHSEKFIYARVICSLLPTWVLSHTTGLQNLLPVPTHSLPFSRTPRPVRASHSDTPSCSRPAQDPLSYNLYSFTSTQDSPLEILSPSPDPPLARPHRTPPIQMGSSPAPPPQPSLWPPSFTLLPSNAQAPLSPG